MRNEFKKAKEIEAEGLLLQVGPMLDDAVMAITKVENLKSSSVRQGVPDAVLESLRALTEAMKLIDSSRRQLAEYLVKERNLGLRPVARQMDVQAQTVANWIAAAERDRKKDETLDSEDA